MFSVAFISLVLSLLTSVYCELIKFSKIYHNSHGIEMQHLRGIESQSQFPKQIGKITFRNSTFPFVPPYIRFCRKEEPCLGMASKSNFFEHHPPKWRNSTISPIVNIAISSGFILTNKTDWLGYYMDREIRPEKRWVKHFQKMNKLPIYGLGMKNFLAKKTQDLVSKFGIKHFGFTPLSFVIPEDLKKLELAWNQSDTWIMKPTYSFGGKGVEVVNKWSQIPKGMPQVIQKYITNPFLLEGKKFDFRIYVLVTGVNPLKIYIKDEYKIRPSLVKYSNDPNSISSQVMHLTNVAVQQNYKGYKNRKIWTMRLFEEYLISKGKDLKGLRESIDDIVIKAIIMAEDFAPDAPYAEFSQYNGYFLFGFDIILDENLHPWLLEINGTPMWRHNRPYTEMAQEMLNIVGYQLPDWMNTTDYDEDKCSSKLTFENLYNRPLSKDEKLKQVTFESAINKSEKNFGKILDELTLDDMANLITAIDEKTQCKMFRRIFPTPTSQTYFTFFAIFRYYNYLLTAWEHAYAGNHQEGINVIMKFWEKNITKIK